MNTIYALTISTIAGMSTFLGGIIIFLNISESKINKFITFCLAFSLAIMIGISITDLIPSSYFTIFLNYNFIRATITLLLSFISGIFLVKIFDKNIHNYDDSLYKLGILNMITLILHNLPEGIATFITSMSDINLGIKLSLSIMFHNIPEGISIAVPIYYATKSKKKALYYTLISGTAEPLGALLAFIFLKNYINDIVISIILLLVAGIMITLGINELLPKALSYKENKMIYIGIFSGIILIILNHFLL